MHHYGVHYDDTIYVELDEGAEFLRCVVFDERKSRKSIINEPEMQVNFLKYPLAIERK